ncbi:hypothetical protein Trihar35433_2949 [Trichoderma harzianum]|nr:hypothetical protein Trihar35433_2949 [Trichoderma harzianum]
MTTVKQPPEELVDSDIQLRRWRSDDVDKLHALVNRSLPELSPWMPWAANGYSKEDAVEALRLGSEGWDAGEEFDYAVVVSDQVRVERQGVDWPPGLQLSSSASLSTWERIV